MSDTEGLAAGDEEAVRGTVALVDGVLGDLDDGLSVSRAGTADAGCQAA